MSIAVVTGASSGMGREFAVQLAKAGDANELWLVARREDRLSELAGELGVKTRIFALDLTKKEDIDALASALKEADADISWLVNAAGFCKFGSVQDVSRADALSMIDLNVRALVDMTYAALPFMSAGGHIVQIASTAAFQPLPYMGVYSASKAFVLSFSRSLGYEIRDSGISVTALCPGWTKTEFFDVAAKNADKGAVTNFFMMSKAENVVRRALKDARKDRALSVYGPFNWAHIIFAKIVPARYMMSIWNYMR